MGSSINLERLRDISLDDEEFMIELVDLFLDDMPEQLEKLRKAVDDKDADSTARAAHRIKGAAGNVGADRLSQICGDLEQSSRAADTTTSAESLEEIEQEWGRVQVAFAGLKDTPAPASS